MPGKYGIPAPPLFCLKPSYWMQSRRGSPGEGHRGAGSPEEPPGDNVEPVPLEFRGKEAIRLELRIVLFGSLGQCSCWHHSAISSVSIFTWFCFMEKQ